MSSPPAPRGPDASGAPRDPYATSPPWGASRDPSAPRSPDGPAPSPGGARPSLGGSTPSRAAARPRVPARPRVTARPRRWTRLTSWSLFWAQVGLGVVAGIGAVIGFASLGGTAELGLLVLGLTLAWLGVCVAGLVALERRKPLAAPPLDDAAWAGHVRDLRASRLEIVTAFEIERRRIERDLHDGAQQHLVAASLKVGEAALVLDTARARGVDVPAPATDLLARAQDDAEAALAALRATVAGIHPAVLTDIGLAAAVRDLAERSGVRATVRVPHALPELPEGVAAAAYFLVAEALTNVAKHAPGAGATVLLSADQSLHVSVVDDGPGGAVVRTGRGLSGMTERLAAFGGTLTLSSPPGGPTTLAARVPLLLGDGAPGVVVSPDAGREEDR